MVTLAGHRQLVVVSLLAALVVGAIVAFATGTWWAVVAALGLHALGTMLTATAAVQLTTRVEHVAPETAARLEAEGIADPDLALTDLVEDFAGSIGLQWFMARSPRAESRRRAGDARGARRRLAPSEEGPCAPRPSPPTS